jgi:(2Fe-2S) ferredoxin
LKIFKITVAAVLSVRDCVHKKAARGLAKLEARVCTSSCLDQCDTGVTVLFERDHFFYGRVTTAGVPEIVDGLVTG